ncbi:hypothetical protein ACFFV7_47920 [Nonomuraea spiralis]|uniref:Uncharacterized protein n=1 Tax=Nonomuraea spiralis TaxID=46182 RepID=A0ABV5IWP2_9ACTN|nr:hypothetical protein [Nonomuraea spiralis]GGT31520.1 hypothetical protein GCM10010176_090230 [Nonomuraea spiralis]
MNLTVQQLLGRFPGWQITDMAGGWVAIRAILVPSDSGLSNVRCGATPAELAGNLQAESGLQRSHSSEMNRCSGESRPPGPAARPSVMAARLRGRAEGAPFRGVGT